MLSKPPTRKQQLRKILEEKGKSLTINELVQFSEIPENKIRQTLTSYENDIVRIGTKRYDLVERHYSGRTFRYTPKKEEIDKGLLSAEEDLQLFLTAAYDYNANITLIDENNNQYRLKRIKTSKLSFMYYRGIARWYRLAHFEIGDDILFTCLNFNQKMYKIRQQKKKEQDEFMIKVKNRKLADMIYDILQHTVFKYEMDLFLVRKYLFIYPYNDPIPPDYLKKAIALDKRFLISDRDRMLSWTGKPLMDYLTIGIRKYYLKNDKGEYMPVVIQSDEFGRFGFCPSCQQKLIWEIRNGWRHQRNDFEYSALVLKSTDKMIL